MIRSFYNKGIKRTSKSTLTTIWVGINDIDLTYNWNQTNALDLHIMQEYESLVVKYTEFMCVCYSY
ncbi:uncharacterized protein BX663DRAFT_525495 [Cokeromyces recurvatus]|uniref:uncharacterized protein n=1 Tax=Cokeromyces recurvatus TaxID=90255 RepID=UPI00221E911B|nr:uncharacterized protein BX663DRAFT_525495 [Cokeromyces recurvatus]KAI7898345.1 hypothetical protein BX663DRAFT_525495 [Cokeromyces recurvatus]